MPTGDLPEETMMAPPGSAMTGSSVCMPSDPRTLIPSGSLCEVLFVRSNTFQSVMVIGSAMFSDTKRTKYSLSGRISLMPDVRSRKMIAPA